MTDPLLQEQIQYYRARAQEYEATALPEGALDDAPASIVKEYYDPDELKIRMALLGFDAIEITRGDYFFRLGASIR